MTDRSGSRTILDQGHIELEAVRSELLQRMEADPQNGELRRDAFEVSGLAERIAWLLDNVESGDSPRLLFTGDLDLALLDRYADEADAPSPYLGDRVPLRRPERAARLRALRALLAVHNYGAAPA
jgi:hypothetical protein